MMEPDKTLAAVQEARLALKQVIRYFRAGGDGDKLLSQCIRALTALQAFDPATRIKNANRESARLGRLARNRKATLRDRERKLKGIPPTPQNP